MASASGALSAAVSGGAAGSVIPGIGTAIGAGVGLLGSLLGGNQAAGSSGAALNDATIANNILQSIQQAPDISKPLILQQYQQAGLMTPELEQAVQLGQSAVSQVGTDQGSLNAQRAALQQLQLTGQMGMTASERNALNQIQQQEGAQVQGNQQAIMNQLHAQAGGAGSMQGLQLMQQLQAEQGGANAAAQQSSNVMANAQQNALQAAAQSGQLGGQINAQQFGQGVTKAQAADQFQRFNVAAQQAAQNANVAAQNQGQMYNLNNAQNLSNANVSAGNQNQYYQNQAALQQWQANAGLAQVQAGGYNNLANINEGNATQQAQAASNTGAGLGGLAGGLVSGLTASGPAQYNTNTGQALYNPQTGVQYGQQAWKGGEIKGYAFGTPDVNGQTMDQASAQDAQQTAQQQALLQMLLASQSAQPQNQPIQPQQPARLAIGGRIHDFRAGGQVPGQATVSGDSPKNDTVPAMLSPGELVIPRTMAKSSLGKRLAKLLEDHHQLRKDIGE